jgi:pimeloyl-ACP methyl ester carboxylesterase
MFTALHRAGSGTPMVCVHGFTDSWRTWELVLGALEREHDVLAPTLPGHAGGPPLPVELGEAPMADAVADAMDAAGWERAHLVGNSLGGHTVLQLAARGRALSVTALAPAGGWAAEDATPRETLEYFRTQQELVRAAAPHADAIMASEEGRRRATLMTTVRYEHLPAELLAHQLRAAAACSGAERLIDAGLSNGWPLEPERIDCPVRVVWGTEDKLLLWPSAAVRYRELLAGADWVVLDDVGHCPQLDVPLETAQLILGFAAA